MALKVCFMALKSIISEMVLVQFGSGSLCIVCSKDTCSDKISPNYN